MRSISACIVWLAAAPFAAQIASGAIVFQDSFGSGSVLNPAVYPAPSVNATGYSAPSTKNVTPLSIAPGALSFGMAATSSGLAQIQARTPIATLSNAGDSVTATVVFTNTGNVALAASSGLVVGLYDAGGSSPVSGLSATGLTETTGSAFATGGTQLWQGYNSRIQASGGTTSFYTRPQQTGGTSTASKNQDLIGNNAGGGLYDDPAGSGVGASQASTLSLVAGNVYTQQLIIARNADGSDTLTAKLFDGAGTGGTNLITHSGTTGTTPLTYSFSGIAFGYRVTANTNATRLDVSSITIETAAGVPEPTTLAVAAGIGFAALRRTRR